MTVKKFHEVLDPKVRGTMNLHEALLGEPLDFFVMTSSTLGFRGPVTQTGYAAANAFMDSMARHRWSLGMQATSLALGMVQEIGHVEAHPGKSLTKLCSYFSHSKLICFVEIKAAMLHNSLYGINETEFLAIMELACQPHQLGSSPLPLSKYDIYSNSLIVTGMESPINSTLQRTWLQDKRFQHLGHEKPAPATTSTFQNSGTLDILLNAFNDGGDFAVKNAVKEIVLKWISKLFLVPVEKLRESMSKPLASFGLDSMVSSEVRALAWSNFKADIPLMKILESGLLFQELLDLIWENMDSGLKSGNALA
jgi:KR domain